MTLNRMIYEMPISLPFTEEGANKQKSRVGDFLTVKGPLGNEMGFAEILEVNVRQAPDDARLFNVVFKLQACYATSVAEIAELTEERERLAGRYRDRIAWRYEE